MPEAANFQGARTHVHLFASAVPPTPWIEKGRGGMEESRASRGTEAADHQRDEFGMLPQALGGLGQALGMAALPS